MLIAVAALATSAACARSGLVASGSSTSPSPTPTEWIDEVECDTSLVGMAINELIEPREFVDRTPDEHERLARAAMTEYVDEPEVEDGGTAFGDYPGISSADFVMTELAVEGEGSRAQFAYFEEGDPVILLHAEPYGPEWAIGGHQMCARSTVEVSIDPNSSQRSFEDD